VAVVAVFELTTTSEELVNVDVATLVESDVVTDVLSSDTDDEEESSEVCVTTVLDVIGVVKVEVYSVVIAVVLVTGGTEVVPLELGTACLFANSTKLLANSGVC